MGAAAAAVIIAKEKDLVAHFRLAGALSAASAKSATELGVDTRFAWYILERRAIIRAAGEGLYYLDEPAWMAHRRRRRRAAIALLVIVLGLLAISVFAAIRAAAAQHLPLGSSVMRPPGIVVRRDYEHARRCRMV